MSELDSATPSTDHHTDSPPAQSGASSSRSGFADGYIASVDSSSQPTPSNNLTGDGSTGWNPQPGKKEGSHPSLIVSPKDGDIFSHQVQYAPTGPGSASGTGAGHAAIDYGGQGGADSAPTANQTSLGYIGSKPDQPNSPADKPADPGPTGAATDQADPVDGSKTTDQVSPTDVPQNDFANAYLGSHESTARDITDLVAKSTQLDFAIPITADLQATAAVADSHQSPADKLTPEQVVTIVTEAKDLNDAREKLGLGPVTDKALADFVIGKVSQLLGPEDGAKEMQARQGTESDRIRGGIITHLDPTGTRTMTTYVRGTAAELKSLQREAYQQIAEHSSNGLMMGLAGMAKGSASRTPDGPAARPAPREVTVKVRQEASPLARTTPTSSPSTAKPTGPGEQKSIFVPLTPRPGSAGPQAPTIWGQGSKIQGRGAETVLEPRTPGIHHYGNFPGIDRSVPGPGGPTAPAVEVGQLKTIDTDAKSYQGRGLTTAINKAAGEFGAIGESSWEHKGQVVVIGPDTKHVLDVAIRDTPLTAAQEAALEDAKVDCASMGVELRIHRVR
jgi:hypothetical protein